MTHVYVKAFMSSDCTELEERINAYLDTLPDSARILSPVQISAVSSGYLVALVTYEVS